MPGSVAAQDASAFLPLDDAAYAYVDALVARGALRELSLLERPYGAAHVRRSLAEVDTVASPALRGWVRALARSLDRWDPPRDEVAVHGRLYALATAVSGTRRELMLASGRRGMHPGAGGVAMLATPHVGAVVRLHADQRLRRDPEFTGSKLRGIAGRTEDAYVRGAWRYGAAFLGRARRNWGAAPLEGLHLGSHADSWDHLAVRLGGERIALSSIVARLDPYAAGGDSGRYERHLSLHRLSLRWSRLEVALAEGVVYGGTGRGPELAYVNPLTLYQLAQYNETGDGNVSYSADVAWRTRTRGHVAAQLLVDDVQVDRCAPACEEPPSYGWSVVGEGLPLARAHRWFGSYTRVANLTYRSPSPWEIWAVGRLGQVGIGRPFSDYDEGRIGVELAAGLAPVRLYLAHRRQGEGDYRLPFPPATAYATTPAFLAGDVHRVTRLAVATGALFARGIEVSGDVGLNRRRGGPPATRPAPGTALEGRVRVTLHAPTATTRP